MRVPQGTSNSLSMAGHTQSLPGDAQELLPLQLPWAALQTRESGCRVVFSIEEGFLSPHRIHLTVYWPELIKPHKFSPCPRMASVLSSPNSLAPQIAVCKS